MNFSFLLNNFNFDNYKTICDLRGGKGLFAEMLKLKFPNSHLISFDDNKLNKYATDYLKGNNLTNAIKLEFGSAINTKLPMSDLFILPHLLLHFDRDNQQKIIENAFNHLNKNGDIIIIENLLSENNNTETLGLTISSALNFQGYNDYALSFLELEKMLKQAGFIEVKLLEKGKCPSDFIIARK